MKRSRIMNIKKLWTVFSLVSLLMVGCAGVREFAGEPVPDSIITANIKTAVLQAGLQSADITVETLDGVVRLTGFVGSPHEYTKTASVVRTVGGVRSIRNEITVRRLK
jgi:osmotically-inducible protein OsmY